MYVYRESGGAYADDIIVETAAILSLLYGRFIDVWRQKELNGQKSRMTKLLLENSSHEGKCLRGVLCS